MMRVCPKCKKKKGLTKFSKSVSTKSGVQVYCKSCNKDIYKDNFPARKAYNVKHNIELHGITLESFQSLRKEQKGKYALCFKIYKPGRGGLNIDHFHGCKKGRTHRTIGKTKYGCPECIRGLLCMCCNWYVVPFLEREWSSHPYLKKRPFRRLNVRPK